jgi:hypothetical protein
MSYLPRLLPALVVDEFEIECVDMAWDISAESHALAVNPYLDVYVVFVIYLATLARISIRIGQRDDWKGVARKVPKYRQHDVDQEINATARDSKHAERWNYRNTHVQLKLYAQSDRHRSSNVHRMVTRIKKTAETTPILIVVMTFYSVVRSID